MQHIKWLILFCVVLVSSESYAARNITLPFSDDLDADNDSDLYWIESGNGATITHDTTGSWDGDGAIKITPPSIAAAAGVNGGQATLGKFQGFASPIIHVRLMLKVGTNYHDTAYNSGGGIGNKFIDVHGGAARTGISFLESGGSGYFEPGMWSMPTATKWAYPGTTYSDYSNEGNIQFDSGSTAADYAGEWIVYEYVINNTASTTSLYIWTADGSYSGEYFTIATTPGVNSTELYIGGYYNHIHTNQTANTYLMISDVVITGTADVIGPPSGFVGWSPTYDWCLDADGDDYYTGSCVNQETDPGAGWELLSSLTGGSDCNDSDILINPGATDICGNSIAEDCVADVACAPGEACEDAIGYCTNPTDCNTYWSYPYYYDGACQLVEEVVTGSAAGGSSFSSGGVSYSVPKTGLIYTR